MKYRIGSPLGILMESLSRLSFDTLGLFIFFGTLIKVK